ncbi:MAG: hypothetical protein K2N51_06495 [Lachnospiraceae bacterium]|nr:hypothetical protein [Lachnospiraceae bacterium]
MITLKEICIENTNGTLMHSNGEKLMENNKKEKVSVQYLNRYEILAHINSQSEGLKSCKTRICQANPRVCSEQLQEKLHLLDHLIKKSMNQEVDFSNVEYMYEMMHLLENDLKKIFSEVKLDIKEMEAILLLTQARLQYLLRWFLKHKSFCDVKELEKIFPLVLESYLHNQQIPKITIDYYLDLCNSTLVNDYDEKINCFDYERWEELQHQWYKDFIV